MYRYHIRLTGNVAGAEEGWLDDDVDIEEDDEFRKRRLQHDKKKRQAEKVRLTKLDGCRQLLSSRARASLRLMSHGSRKNYLRGKLFPRSIRLGIKWGHV